MKLAEVESWQASKRWNIAPGAVVRFAGGGPEFIGDDGEPHRFTLPGAFRVRAVFRAGRTRHRYFLEVSGVDRVGGTYTVFVGGKPYRSTAGPICRPYRVKRPRSKTRREAV